jgi:glucose/arabinose dehydrogenase
MRHILNFSFIAFIVVFQSACHGPSQGQHSENKLDDKALVFQLQQVSDSLTAPVALENAHDGSGRLFVGEQGGRIRIIQDGRLLKAPFLDISNLLVPMENIYLNVGLLGFAFHPDYRHNGRFFVHYIAPCTKPGFDNQSVIEEFHVSKDNPNRADPDGKIILRLPQPEQNRNGGNMVFGPDGDLYIGFGDGGNHGKTKGSSQDLSTLFGKIIRIDVDHGAPYQIPQDNPFLGTKARGEIWAYGFRMPWRISFDRQTGQLFCGDVGEGTYEEVDLVKEGGNYGWDAREADHPYDTALDVQGADFIGPIAEYKHTEGVCVIGGYVYRGSSWPALDGKYIYADFTAKLFYLSPEHGQWESHVCRLDSTRSAPMPHHINSFGEGEDGTIYLIGQNKTGALSPSGVVYKIAASYQ